MSNKPWEGIPTNQWYGTPPSLPEFCWKPKNQVWISLRQTTAKPWRAVVLISGFSSISVCLTVCGDDPSTTSLLRTLNMKQDGGTTKQRKPGECRVLWDSIGFTCDKLCSKPVGILITNSSWHGRHYSPLIVWTIPSISPVYLWNVSKCECNSHFHPQLQICEHIRDWVIG